MKRSLGLALAALVFVAAGATARASNKYLEVPPFEQVKRTPAYKYANLSDLDALAALVERKIPFLPIGDDVAGVRTPIRLTGRLHGVSVHSALPEAERSTSPIEILDARLALALDDFCALLARHDVVELIHYTMYRPAPSDEPAFRHPGGLAIDLGVLVKKDGTRLPVAGSWPSAVGARTCGAAGRRPKSRAGRELNAIVCEAAEQRLFTYQLTPHFDRHHADHIHLELKPGVKWFLVN